MAGKADEKVEIDGFVHALRIQSKIAFMNVRDITGIVQVVVMKDSPTFETVKGLSIESVVRISGSAKAEKNAPGGVEIQIESIEVLSVAAPELPIPVVSAKGGEETEAPTRFDYRWIDLRKPEKAKIFKVWTELEKGFREYWNKNNFIQIYSPSFMSTALEK